MNLRSGSEDPEPDATTEVVDAVVDAVVGIESRLVDDTVRLSLFELELALLRSG